MGIGIKALNTLAYPVRAGKGHEVSQRFAIPYRGQAKIKRFGSLGISVIKTFLDTENAENTDTCPTTGAGKTKKNLCF